MIRIFETKSRANKIPINWGHSKLVALWKSSPKGKRNDPKPHPDLLIGCTLSIYYQSPKKLVRKTTIETRKRPGVTVN